MSGSGVVTDGTSHTFLIGEMSRFRNEPPGSHFYFNNITAVWAGPPWTAVNPAWPNDSRVTSGAFVSPSSNAPPDTDRQCNRLVLRRRLYPPDWINVPACQNLGQLGFRSLHPGAANFAFADGSVKFIKDGVNLTIYRALGTRAGGEVIGADQY